MDVWEWLCWVFKYIVNAAEVFIEFICSRVCIFYYVTIFVLNVDCGRIRFKTSSCIPAHIIFGFLTFEFMASLKKSCDLKIEDFSKCYSYSYLFHCVIVSSFDGIKNFLIHPARLLTRFDPFLFEWNMFVKEREKYCTAAEYPSYEFIFDQDCWTRSERKASSSICFCLSVSYVIYLNG